MSMLINMIFYEKKGCFLTVIWVGFFFNTSTYGDTTELYSDVFDQLVGLFCFDMVCPTVVIQLLQSFVNMSRLMCQTCGCSI